MLRSLLSVSLIALSAHSAAAHEHAAKEYTAELVGHAILPAKTLVAAPADAPAALQTSGKFAPKRRDAAPTDGAELPFNGQPVQGFSGISARGDGSYYVLTDNGFGSKANSPDAMLFFQVISPNWESGEVARDKIVFLSDPDHKVPFVIQMEGSDSRYLTGSDFDIEGFQVIGDHIYIGDEFGPFVIKANAETGVVEAVFDTMIGDTQVMSPDNYQTKAGNPDKPASAANLKRSRGYEGFAKSVDGTKLYPMLEGPIWNAEAGDYERVDGNFALRILQWDVASDSWDDRSVFYRLEADNHAIGDFNMIDETRGLVIERDGGQGDVELACEDGATEGCFKKPALFKRVYMIDMKGVGNGEPVHKVAYIDLLNMQDPNGVARLGQREDGSFRFPFVTIEDVDLVDGDHIIVGNDNNFPFSKGRDLVARDNNELVLLKVSDFLKAAAK